MQKNNQKNNEQGFTILNLLFAFSVFLLIVSFFPVVVNLLKIDHPKNTYEIDMFFEYVRVEIVGAKQLATSGSTLVLLMGDGTNIRYEKYNSNIRRQVNGMGNEILIQDVQNVNYELVPNGVVISVEIGGQVVKKRLSLSPTIFFTI